MSEQREASGAAGAFTDQTQAGTYRLWTSELMFLSEVAELLHFDPQVNNFVEHAVVFYI